MEKKILNLKETGQKNNQKSEEGIFHTLKKKLLEFDIDNTKNSKIIKNIYNFSKLGKRKELELEQETFKVLYKLLETHIDYCHYKYLDDTDKKGQQIHWMNKAIIINMVSLNILEIDGILQKIVENKDNSWTIRNSALTGLFLRQREENLEIIKKIANDKNDEDRFIKRYAKKYVLMNKILKNPRCGWKYYIEYYKDYITYGEFDEERVLSFITKEIMHLRDYYYFSGLSTNISTIPG